MIGSDLLPIVVEVLAQKPTDRGGVALILVSSSNPPAVVVLSTGDVVLHGDRLRIGVHAGSSLVHRVGGSMTLVVPLGGVVARVEFVDVAVAAFGDIASISGRIVAIRPTSEPPWIMSMTFQPVPGNDPRVPIYLDYWRQMALWLSGERADPPPLPQV